jgi:hypothetical protein
LFPSGIVDTRFSLVANSIYYAYLVTSATASGANTNGTPAAPSSARALADPEVVIDPAWAAGHPGYSLEFSAGVNAVPEPQSASMLLVGALLMGAMARKRRAFGGPAEAIPGGRHA